MNTYILRHKITLVHMIYLQLANCLIYSQTDTASGSGERNPNKRPGQPLRSERAVHRRSSMFKRSCSRLGTANGEVDSVSSSTYRSALIGPFRTLLSWPAALRDKEWSARLVRLQTCHLVEPIRISHADLSVNSSPPHTNEQQDNSRLSSSQLPKKTTPGDGASKICIYMV